MPKATTIKLYDEIGGWGIWFSDFERQLAQASGDVELLIHSPGGNAFDGMAMANAVKAYDRGKVTGIVMGLCASAAGFVLAACDVRKMYAASQFMCHEASVMAWGKEADLMDAARRLVDINRQQAEMFAQITGKSVDDVLALLKAETWYTAKAAKAEGFIHEIIDAKVPATDAKVTDAKVTAQWMARFQNIPAEWAQRAAPFRAAASLSPIQQRIHATAPAVAKQKRPVMSSRKQLVSFLASGFALMFAKASEAAEDPDSELQSVAKEILAEDKLPAIVALIKPLAEADGSEESQEMATALAVYEAAKEITGAKEGVIGALEALKRNADSKTGPAKASISVLVETELQKGIKATKILPAEGDKWRSAIASGKRSLADLKSFLASALPAVSEENQQPVHGVHEGTEPKAATGKSADPVVASLLDFDLN